MDELDRVQLEAAEGNFASALRRASKLQESAWERRDSAALNEILDVVSDILHETSGTRFHEQARFVYNEVRVRVSTIALRSTSRTSRTWSSSLRWDASCLRHLGVGNLFRPRRERLCRPGRKRFLRYQEA